MTFRIFKCFSAFLMVCIFAFSSNGYSQMNVAFDYGTFSHPEKGPYIETYILIPASSITYAEVENGYQASAQITIMLKQGEEIKSFDKYVLNSDIVSEAEKASFNMMDLKRLSAPSGEYVYSVDVLDMADSENKASVSFPLQIDEKDEKTYVSDILLVEKISTSEEDNVYTRGEYDMIPNVIRFYPESVNGLKYYAEVKSYHFLFFK